MSFILSFFLYLCLSFFLFSFFLLFVSPSNIKIEKNIHRTYIWIFSLLRLSLRRYVLAKLFLYTTVFFVMWLLTWKYGVLSVLLIAVAHRRVPHGAGRPRFEPGTYGYNTVPCGRLRLTPSYATLAQPLPTELRHAPLSYAPRAHPLPPGLSHTPLSYATGPLTPHWATSHPTKLCYTGLLTPYWSQIILWTKEDTGQIQSE